MPAIQTITASYSEIDTFRQCPLKWHLAYRQRWSKPAREGGPLARGLLWHQVMDVHYSTLKAATHPTVGSALTRSEVKMMERNILAICRKAVDPLLSDPESGEQTEDQELIQWMYEGYVQAYGADPGWEILEVEVKIVVPLYFKRLTRFRLKTKIDLIVRDRDTGDVWIIDHKTGGNLPGQMDLDLDDQFGLYEIAWNRQRHIRGERLILGTIHNAARTQRNKSPMTLESRFDRTPMNRTPIELRNIEMDAVRTLRAAYGAPNLEAPYSSPDPRQCGWKCDFTDAHLIARKGGSISEALLDYGFARYTGRH